MMCLFLFTEDAGHSYSRSYLIGGTAVTKLIIFRRNMKSVIATF
jgi:hypothetical protein